MPLTTDTARCRAWLEARIAGLKTHPETVFIGAESGSGDGKDCGKLTTVVAFSHYVPDTDIALSVAHEGRGAASRELMRAVLSYVFQQSNCVRCTVRIADGNERSIRLAQRLGFQQEGRLRRGFGDRDALLFGLLRDEIWHPQATPPRHPIPT